MSRRFNRIGWLTPLLSVLAIGIPVSHAANPPDDDATTDDAPLGGPQRSAGEGDEDIEEGAPQDDRRPRRRSWQRNRPRPDDRPGPGGRRGRRGRDDRPVPRNDQMPPEEMGGPGAPLGDEGEFPERFPMLGELRKLSPREMEALFRVLEEHYPEMHARLSELRERDPREFERRVRQFMPMIRRLLRAEPPLRQIMIRDHKLQWEIERTVQRAQQLRSAGGSATEMDDVRAHLRDVLEQQFDLRMDKHRRMLTEIESRLERQRSVYESRLSNRTVLIDERMDKLLPRDEGMVWPD